MLKTITLNKMASADEKEITIPIENIDYVVVEYYNHSYVMLKSGQRLHCSDKDAQEVKELLNA